LVKRASALAKVWTTVLRPKGRRRRKESGRRREDGSLGGVRTAQGDGEETVFIARGLAIGQGSRKMKQKRGKAPIQRADGKEPLPHNVRWGRRVKS